MPSLWACPDRLNDRSPWDFGPISVMGEFDLEFCTCCGLPRGGFRGNEACHRNNFPIPLDLPTCESKFALGVFRCAKLVQYQVDLPTAGIVYDEANQPVVFFNPSCWG